MYSKKNQDPLPKEEIEVWECESEACIGWMRKNFSYEVNQKCPLCGHTMKAGKRLLEKASNPHKR